MGWVNREPLMLPDAFSPLAGELLAVPIPLAVSVPESPAVAFTCFGSGASRPAASFDLPVPLPLPFAAVLLIALGGVFVPVDCAASDRLASRESGSG